jgi:hypothetical protein
MLFAGGPALDPCLVLHHDLQSQKRTKAVTMTLANDEWEKWDLGLPPRRTVQVGPWTTFPSCGCLSEIGNAQRIHTSQCERNTTLYFFEIGRVNQDIAA